MTAARARRTVPPQIRAVSRRHNQLETPQMALPATGFFPQRYAFPVNGSVWLSFTSPDMRTFANSPRGRPAPDHAVHDHFRRVVGAGHFARRATARTTMAYCPHCDTRRIVFEMRERGRCGGLPRSRGGMPVDDPSIFAENEIRRDCCENRVLRQPDRRMPRPAKVGSPKARTNLPRGQGAPARVPRSRTAGRTRTLAQTAHGGKGRGLAACRRMRAVAPGQERPRRARRRCIRRGECRCAVGPRVARVLRGVCHGRL